MDLQDIWQEHRRFILGCFIGLLGFFVLRGIIGTVLDTETSLRAPSITQRRIIGNERYDSEARSAARELNETLKARAEELRDATAFAVREEFRLEGKGDPEIYFPSVERRVRSDVLRAAQELGIELADTDLKWQPPVGREEIARTLVALDALETATQRLFEASNGTVARDPDALGVQSIERIEYQTRGGNSAAILQRRRRARAVTASDDLVSEHRIAFQFRADVMTVQTWIEALKAGDPPLALDADLKIKPGEQVGDPVLVLGTLLALTVQEPDAR